MSRDFAVEMRAVVDAETGEGSYVSRVVAETVVSKLRATDPDLLNGWLDRQAEQVVWQFINDRDRSTRSHARQATRRRAFAEDAAAAEQGEPERLVRWLNVPFALEDGTRKPLGIMRGNDALFVADTYDARAREDKLHAAFFRAIARKVGKDQVKDHYSDEQLTAMWQSLTEN